MTVFLFVICCSGCAGGGAFFSACSCVTTAVREAICFIRSVMRFWLSDGGVVVVGSCDSVGFVVLELEEVKLRGFIEFGLGGGLSVRVLVVERVWVVFVGMV